MLSCQVPQSGIALKTQKGISVHRDFHPVGLYLPLSCAFYEKSQIQAPTELNLDTSERKDW
jgi:hypothetical protein